jgi:protein SCO1/2
MIVRAAALAALAGAALPPPAAADTLRPPLLRDIEVTERLGERIPLAIPFLEAGPDGPIEVELGDYFVPGRPVILVLAYSRCPMLCDLVLRGARDGVRGLDLDPGSDYQTLAVSIDDEEGPDLAAATRAAIERDLGASGWTGTWPVLIGPRASIDRLASRLGFGFARDPRSGQIAHPAVVFVLGGDGTISRYLYGTRVEPAELASSLLAAAADRPQRSIGSAVLSCFRFTGALAKYGDVIQLAFRIGAALIFAALLIALVLLARWERRRSRRGQ